jgi:hypothetical protein
MALPWGTPERGLKKACCIFRALFPVAARSREWHKPCTGLVMHCTSGVRLALIDALL